MRSDPPNLEIVDALSEDDPHFDMSDPKSYALLEEAEDKHFWHKSRSLFIVDRLHELGIKPPSRVLDLGCGGGAVSAHLQREGYSVVGVEGHAGLARRAALRAPNAKFIVHDLALGAAALKADDSFDAVGLFDVIEHLDDPGAAIREALRCCRVGGFVVGTVPALRMLWSVVDEVAGHRVRYERRDLGALLEEQQNETGASIRQIRDFNRLLVPLMWVQRKRIDRNTQGASQQASDVSRDNLTLPPQPINKTLYYAIRAEHRAREWLDRLPIPGASLWFALKKNRRAQ